MANEKLEKILALAFHPNTGKDEAVAAFLAARKIKIQTKDETPKPKKLQSYGTEISPVSVRFYFQLINDITDMIFEGKGDLLIKMKWNSVEDKSALSARITFDVLGTEKEIEHLKQYIKTYIAWANERLEIPARTQPKKGWF